MLPGFNLDVSRERTLPHHVFRGTYPPTRTAIMRSSIYLMQKPYNKPDNINVEDITPEDYVEEVLSYNLDSIFHPHLITIRCRIYFTTITSVELEQEGCFFCDFLNEAMNIKALRQELKIENRRGLCRSNNGFESKYCIQN
ncbi:hypothetical protein C0J52_24535 [Blattella germanica]|nr:hypothetical protein C0J52_24535 [Blattella germanica]